jgi:GTP-binding protein HflX
MTRAVDDVLYEIGADRAPRLLVLAKADLVGEDRRRELANRHPDGVLVSAQTEEGLEGLTQRIEGEFARALQDVELLIPYEEGSRLAELHQLAGNLERDETAAGVRVQARLPGSVAERFRSFALG